MDKEFDKTSFENKNIKTLLYSLLIGAIAIASLICGLSIKTWKKEMDKGPDPEDYYGIYYAAFDNEYLTISLESDYCKITTSNGLKGTGDTKKYHYDYVSAKYAQAKLANDKYDGCPAILLYTTSGDVIALWVTSTNPYRFEIGSNGAKVTQETFDFASKMNDPKDYYYTYSYGSNNRISLNRDGTATLVMSGESGDYLFAYVNESWLEIYTNYNYDAAIVCYKEKSNLFQIFEYVDNTELKYAGEYSFKRE